MKIIKELEQGSSEWLKTRAGVITGTRLQQVMAKKGTLKRKGLIFELIAEQLAPLEENFTTDAMERGHLLEDIFKESIKEDGFEEVGFIYGEKSWIGLSPDLVKVEKNGEIKRAKEIKSPKAKNYIKYAIDNKIPAEYFWQVIHYFVVIDTLEELEFIIFNPEIYIEELRVVKIKITREELKEDIEKAKENLEEFRQEWLENLKKLNRE